ncbi:MAG: WG repeat-containing protein [Crocinitomicaceae bacterium]
MKSLLIILFIGISTAFSQAFIGNLFPVDSAGKYALYNNKGEQKSNWIRYDKVESTIGLNYFKVQKFGRWGLADTSLNQKLACDFQDIYINYGYIFAEKPSELYILNSRLDTLKTIKDFNRISFSIGYEKEWSRYKSSALGEFRTIIHTLNGTGVMNDKLEWVCDPKYDDGFWMENLAFLRQGEKFGFLSNTNELIEPQFKTMGFFNKKVVEFKDINDHRSYYLLNGEKIPDSDSTLVFDVFYGNYKIYKAGKGELYSSNLEKLIEHSFDDVYQISSKYKLHGLTESLNQKVEPVFAYLQNGKVGATDKNGSTIIPAEYQHVESAFNGFFIVQTIEDSLFGVVNSSNQFVIQPTFTFIEYYKTYFRVFNENEKGILNEYSDTLVPIEFDEINFEAEGFITKNKSGKGFYTPNGKLILKNSYSSVYRSTGGLEFRSKKGDCLVNENGLLTMPYSKHVSRTANKVKYYYGGQIIIKELKDEKIVDSTVYKAPKSIYIEDRWRSSFEIVMSTDSYVTFQNQLNSKFGSKAKKKIDWGIPAVYDNVHKINTKYRVKKPHQESFNFADQYFNTKEKIAPFYGGSAHRERFLLAYEGRDNSRTWHSSVFDPTINMDQEIEYYSTNYYVTGPQPLILKRYGFNSVILKQGDFSLDNGQRIMTYKDFFEDLNECNNFEIVNKYQFGKMSQNPMITVQNPTWKVLMIEENQTFNSLGNFTLYQELESGSALVKKQEGNYNIIYAGNKELIEGGAEDIKVIMLDEFEYYLVQQYYTTSLGSSDLGWTLYNTAEKVLEDYFDQIEVIDYNHFKVKKDNKIMWMDNKGKILKSIQLY